MLELLISMFWTLIGVPQVLKTGYYLVHLYCCTCLTSSLIFHFLCLGIRARRLAGRFGHRATGRRGRGRDGLTQRHQAGLQEPLHSAIPLRKCCYDNCSSVAKHWPGLQDFPEKDAQIYYFGDLYPENCMTLKINWTERGALRSTTGMSVVQCMTVCLAIERVKSLQWERSFYSVDIHSQS